MSRWRGKALELFPEYRHGSFAFNRPSTTIYQIFFKMKHDLDQKILAEDWDWLNRVIAYVEWCFQHRNTAPEIWEAAATAFVEHLADTDERAALIPAYVNELIFEDMKAEFIKRRDRVGEGKGQELLDAYNSSRDSMVVR